MPSHWATKVDWYAVHSIWQGLPKGDRTGYIDQLAETVCRSRNAVYRELRRRFGKKKEVSRAPKVNEALVREIAKIKKLGDLQKLKGKRRGREVSTRAAIRILKKEGWKGAEALYPSTVNTALVRMGYREDKPVVRVRADYACQQFQMDFSRSKYFQVWKRDGDDWLLKVSARELHYKLDEYRMRTWLVQLKDEYSRLRLVRAYAATSESAILGITFLNWCFNRSEDDHQMRHLPERLKCDQGSFLKSRETVDLLDTLGIEPRRTIPGNKDSQGKVEAGFGGIWQTFESVLAVELERSHGPGCTIRLSEYNERLHEHLIEEHGETHPDFKGEKRGDLYQRSVLIHRPREVAVDLRMLAYETWERKVANDRSVSINNVQFEAPARYIGHWIRVRRNRLGDFLGEPISAYGEAFPLNPYHFYALDDFEHRPHQTFGQEIEQEVKCEQRRKVRKLRPAAEKVEPQSPFIEAQKPEAPKRISLLDARAEFGRQLIASGLTRDMLPAWLDRYTETGAIRDGMTYAEIAHVIDGLLTASKQAM